MTSAKYGRRSYSPGHSSRCGGTRCTDFHPLSGFWKVSLPGFHWTPVCLYTPRLCDWNDWTLDLYFGVYGDCLSVDQVYQMALWC